MFENLRIAIVLNTTWNIYNFRMGVLKALAEEGAEMIVIAPNDKYVDKIKAQLDCQFVPLTKLDRCGTNILGDLGLLMELRRIYKKERIDVALQYTIKPNIYGSLAGRLTGTKTISTVTGLGISFLKHDLVNRVVRRLYKTAFWASDRVAFQNNADRYFFLGAGLVQKQKAFLIEGSGINTGQFNPDNYPERDSNKMCFMFMGRLLRYKGILEYLQASERLLNEFPEAECWILGGYDESNPECISKAELEKYIAHPRIKYLGEQPDVRPIMAAANTLVLPSDSEGLAKSLLEALSMKLPIITTDIPGCQETLEHGVNGFLIPHRDTDMLFGAMQQMAALSPEERVKMGEEGRMRALRRFDERIVISHYVQLIKQVTSAEAHLYQPLEVC